MSHFTVAVIHEEDEDVDDILAPYQENNMGDCPQEYMEFNDVEEDERDGYAKNTIRQVKTPTGEFISPYDEKYKNPNYNWGKNKDEKQYIYPEGFVEVEVPAKDLYATFDEYIKDYSGYSKDEETGRYGYWENPEARWDWYVIGGRWKNSLYLKEGGESKLEGEDGIFGSGDLDRENDPRWCDSAKIKDIDWEGMDRLNREKRGNWYDEAMQWKENHTGEKTEEEIKNHLNWHFSIECTDGVFESKQAYIDKEGGFSTYSVLMDGEWLEAGKMGWWGVSHSGEIERGDWKTNYTKLIEKWVSEYPDHVLTIVDCHI